MHGICLGIFHVDVCPSVIWRYSLSSWVRWPVVLTPQRVGSDAVHLSGASAVSLPLQDKQAGNTDSNDSTLVIGIVWLPKREPLCLSWLCARPHSATELAWQKISFHCQFAYLRIQFLHFSFLLRFDFPPFSNRLLIPSSNSCFQAEIWLACPSYVWASSASVFSSLAASRATFALNPALWFRLFRRILGSFLGFLSAHYFT